MSEARKPTPEKEFDKALRSYQAGERRYRRGEGSPRTAMTMGAAQATMQRLLDEVDEARRERYRRVVP